MHPSWIPDAASRSSRSGSHPIIRVWPPSVTGRGALDGERHDGLAARSTSRPKCRAVPRSAQAGPASLRRDPASIRTHFHAGIRMRRTYLRYRPCCVSSLRPGSNGRQSVPSVSPCAGSSAGRSLEAEFLRLPHRRPRTRPGARSLIETTQRGCGGTPGPLCNHAQVEQTG